MESARVGNQTDYDGLVLEVWTDGRVEPVQATVQAADLINEHISIFAAATDPGYLEEEEEAAEPAESDEAEGDEDQIAGSGISVRTAEILKNEGIVSFSELAEMTEDNIKKINGIGPKAFEELKDALKDRGLAFITNDDITASIVRKGGKK